MRYFTTSLKFLIATKFKPTNYINNLFNQLDIHVPADIILNVGTFDNCNLFGIIDINEYWFLDDVSNQKANLQKSIGHELGHSFIDKLKYRKLTKSYATTKANKIFINYVVETFCDFYIFKVFSCDKQSIVNAFKTSFLLNEKKTKHSNTYTDKIHPSHYNRLNYINNTNFDKNLIMHISQDVQQLTSQSVNIELIELTIKILL